MLFLLLLLSYCFTTSKPLLFGGGTSLTLRFETLFTTLTSLKVASPFVTFLLVEAAGLEAGKALFPAEKYH